MMNNLLNETYNEESYDLPFTDEEFAGLISLYYHKPIIFCKQILNVEPDEQQIEVIEELYSNKIVTVKSGRGAGKTWVSAMIVWHFLCTRHFAQVYATAPTAATISGGLWPTLSKINTNMNALYKDEFEVQTSNIKHKEFPLNWFVMSRTARAENSDALAGGHAGHMLYVIDEASGLSTEHFDAIFGSLTEENNYMIMLSNPRRLSGAFYNSHRPHSAKIFSQLTMSAIKSKWVTPASVKKWEVMYGKDSNQYKVEVEGNFPTREDGSIIPLDQVLESVDRLRTFEHNEEIYGSELRWGLDIGAGGDKTVLTKRKGRLLYNDIKIWNEKDTMKVVGLVAKEYKSCKPEDRPVGIYVDNVALGKGAYDRMKELKLPVVPCHASAKAKDKKFYWCAKAENWGLMRDWFRDDKPFIPDNSDLIEQLSTVREKIMSDGRFMVEDKKTYKKRNPQIGSPDIADSVSFTFSTKKASKIDDDSVVFL